MKELQPVVSDVNGMIDSVEHFGNNCTVIVLPLKLNDRILWRPNLVNFLLKVFHVLGGSVELDMKKLVYK